MNLPLQQIQLASIIASAMDAIISVDADQRIVLFNPAAEAMFRCSAADALGQPLDRFIPERFRTAHHQHLRAYGQTGETRRHMLAPGQLTALRADGEEFPIEASISQSGSADDKLFTVTLRDITERQRAEETLREREFWLRESQRVARIGTYRFDVPAGTWDSTEVLDSIFGIDRAYPKTVEGWLALIHPDERNEMQAYLLKHVLGAKEPFDREYRILRPSDGQERWIAGRGELTLDAHGAPVAMLGMIQDITERKRAEEALRVSETKYRSLVSEINDGIYITDTEGVFTFANPALARMYGLDSPQALIGKSFTDLAAPELLPELRQAYQDAMQIGRRPDVITGQIHRPDGTRVFVEIKPVNIIEAGQVVGSQGVVRDVTERTRAEAIIRESEERYHSLFENMLEGFAHCQMLFEGSRPQDFIYLDVNAAFGELTGLTDVVGKKVTEVIPRIRESNPELFEIYGRVALTGQPEKFETYVEALGIWLSVSVYSTKKEHFVAVFDNITARKRREQELQALATVSAALRTAPTRADMLPVILEQLSSLLKAEGAALAMRDQTTGETVLEQAHGAFVGALRPRLPPGEGVSGHVMTTGAPYVTADIRAESRLAWPELLTRIRAVACVPLTAQGVMLGALWVGRPAAFNPGEVRLLTAIADMAANAIYRATLHEQAQRNVERLIALRTIDLAITSNYDLRLTLAITLEQVIQQLQVDAADVLLFDQGHRSLDCVAARGFRGAARAGLSLAMGSQPAGQTVLGGTLIRLPDLAEAETPFAHAATLAGEDFRAYFAAPLIAKGQVIGVLEVFRRTPLTPDEEWLDFLEALAGQVAIAAEEAWLFDGLQRSNQELTQAYDATIEGWSRAMDLRDKETEGHTLRVTEMTLRLARAMGISQDDLLHVRRGALLHDIGKLGVPDAILLKPGKLTDEEWVVMRKHPVYAYELLSPIDYLKPALDIPYYHHEKWDGTGYPHGLSGEQIPLMARIFAVVDVWDALRSDRPYRPGWPMEKVHDYLRDQAGKHFDPTVVDVFLKILNEAPRDG